MVDDELIAAGLDLVKGGEEDGDGEDADIASTEAFDLAADQLFDAVKNGDKQAFREVFRDAVHMATLMDD